jgi:hypothetical protein
MNRLLTLIPLLSSAALYAADHAKPPIFLEAGNVLPAEQLKGSNYQVDAKVRNDGLINSYKLDTDYGALDVESTAELQVRIEELNALVIMGKLERKEVFKESAVKGVKAVGEGVTELVTDPVDTSKEIVKGAGQFLSNIGHAFVSDDPDQDNALKVALGYDAAKRQFAYEFGINPYSEYEPAMDRLGEIARAAVAGGIAPKAALAAVDHTAATIARVSGTMRGMQKLVRDNPPNKLRDINRDKLRAMGLSEELSDAFLDNYNYDPYEETLVVGELETMDVAGRDAFISRANLATEKSTALYYRSMAQMMAGYNSHVEAVKAIRVTSGVLNLERKDGSRIVLAPVDYVFWTEELEGRLNGYEQALAADAFSGKKELWLTGQIAKQARLEFEQRRWKVREKANPVLLKE